MADRVYIEPITLETISIILRGRPQGIIAIGGQTGLNMAVELQQKRHPR